MQNMLGGIFGQGKMTEVLLTVGWADKHPFLFTLIQIMPAAVIGVAALKIILTGVMSARR